MNEVRIKKLARIALGANLVFAGISHLTFARKTFRAQVPNWVPLKKDDTVVFGVCRYRIGGSIVLIPERQEKNVGKITRAFFTAVFPGNIAQYTQERSAFGLNTNNKRLTRLFFQPVLLYWTLKSTNNV